MVVVVGENREKIGKPEESTATRMSACQGDSTMVRRISQRLRTAPPSLATSLLTARQRLQQLQPLVTRILDQTRARLLGGDTHVPDNVLSIF
jgi:hypothetical protein